MQFVVTMRDGSSYAVEAAYLEVVDGPSCSSYTLLGPVPGYPTAILAVFPSELVVSILPAQAATPIRAPAARADAEEPVAEAGAEAGDVTGDVTGDQTGDLDAASDGPPEPGTVAAGDAAAEDVTTTHDATKTGPAAQPTDVRAAPTSGNGTTGPTADRRVPTGIGSGSTYDLD